MEYHKYAQVDMPEFIPYLEHVGAEEKCTRQQIIIPSFHTTKPGCWKLDLCCIIHTPAVQTQVMWLRDTYCTVKPWSFNLRSFQ